MAADVPTILATTMGFHRGGRAWTPGPVFDFAFALAGKPAQPKLCFLSTGTGDNPASVAGFYGAFAGTRVWASHVALLGSVEVVADRPGAGAYRVERGDDGQTVEITLEVLHRLE